MEIKDAIRELSRSAGNIRSLICTVQSVDREGCSCELLPLDGSPELKKVRLTATEAKNNTVVVYPKIGTFAIATMIDMNDAFVSMIDEADEIEIIPHGKVIISNDDESLKTLIDDLIDAIKNITVTTGTGPSGTPVNFAEFDEMKTRFEKLLKDA